jgi:hypothetical protein
MQEGRIFQTVSFQLLRDLHPLPKYAILECSESKKQLLSKEKETRYVT